MVINLQGNQQLVELTAPGQFLVQAKQYNFQVMKDPGPENENVFFLNADNIELLQAAINTPPERNCCCRVVHDVTVKCKHSVHGMVSSTIGGSGNADDGNDRVGMAEQRKGRVDRVERGRNSRLNGVYDVYVDVHIHYQTGNIEGIPNGTRRETNK